MPIVRACLIRWWNAVCDESRPHGVGSSENRTRLGENREDEEAPSLTEDVEVSIRPGGNAVQITASFNEDIKGFRLQYVSLSDGVYNDFDITDLDAGIGTYKWTEDGNDHVTSTVTKETEPNGRYDIYKFERPDGSFYELWLDNQGRTISVIFSTPYDLDDDTFRSYVEMLIADPSTHLKVTDEAGNTSDDLLHE